MIRLLTNHRNKPSPWWCSPITQKNTTVVDFCCCTNYVRITSPNQFWRFFFCHSDFTNHFFLSSLSGRHAVSSVNSTESSWVLQVSIQSPGEMRGGQGVLGESMVNDNTLNLTCGVALLFCFYTSSGVVAKWSVDGEVSPREMVSMIHKNWWCIILRKSMSGYKCHSLLSLGWVAKCYETPWRCSLFGTLTTTL